MITQSLFLPGKNTFPNIYHLEMSIDPLNLAERALSHFREGSTDQSESVMKMPIEAYTDPDRYKRESNLIFRHLPMAAALSIELPEAGNYKAMTVLDVPILLVRGKDGKARAFLNVCRHRGAGVPLALQGWGAADL